MSVGIACVLLIYLYVSQEFSYNDFHNDKNLIHRLNTELKLADGNIYKLAVLDYKLPGKLEKEVPQIEKSTAYREAYEVIFNYNNQIYKERLSLADANFFKIFSFDLIAGNRDKLFTNPDEIVITRKLADKYLKTNSETYQDLLGHTIILADNGPFTISGILEDMPINSTISFAGIIPNYKYNSKFPQSNTFTGNSLVYVKLKKGSDVNLARKNITTVFNEHYASIKSNLQRQNILSPSDNCLTPFLLSLNDVYLEDNIWVEYEKSSSKKYLGILSAIGLLILLIGCFNYVTLTLGQSLKQVGQVSIRKTFGAKPINIFKVFFAEGTLLTLISLSFGILLCILLMPMFGNLAHTKIFIELVNFPKTIIYGLTGFFLVVILTSLVPGLIFSKIQPNLMTAKKMAVGRKSNFSQVFVAFQYSISIILIISTIFISRQVNYMKNKPLGFDKESVIDINIDYLDNDKKLALNDMLKQHSGILNSSLTSRNFINGRSNTNIKKNSYENIEVRQIKVDHNYLPTIGLELLQGKNFTKQNVKKHDNAIIVNKALTEKFDFEAEPIGKMLNVDGEYFTIIVVVNDFHFDTMKEKIEPLMLYARTNMGNYYRNILIKFQPEQLSGLIEHIKESWEQVAPELELNYSFWDTSLENRYLAEERWAKIVSYSSLIAIIISSLGLFGLTILLINQRIKEIGVRKVNGAKIIELLGMLNKDFVKWVAIAFMIGCPVSYYAISKWLEDFAYKTELSWWIFALAGVLALGIALLTVSWQSWKAATRNPVEALRYE
jgi:putative ABC transport system permease protein